LAVLAFVAAGLMALSVVWVGLYRLIAPPVTPLMLLRAADGAAMTHDWRPLGAIAPALGHAVIAAEDSGFCRHWGFEWVAVRKAWASYQANSGNGDRLRGGSTISQQVAKNAFLWPGRNWLRKGLEAWFTLLIEGIWPKRRILEVYLNVVEWGNGVYGAESAARRHFGKPASALSATEAARLAVVLPAPRRWSPTAPPAWSRRRLTAIRQGMADGQRSGLFACLS